jgi:hypothetical protein
MTSIIKVDEIQNSAGTTTLAKVDNGVLTGALSPATGFRNRIINGDMRIDQRNAGALVSGTSGATFAVDRTSINVFGTGTGRISGQQSTTIPSGAGFVKSLIATVTTADTSPTEAFGYCLMQRIEGFNIADLGWGAAGASAVTVSFWVRSSIAGTYVFTTSNIDNSRSYSATYTVSASNTWEFKTITIPGDTSGTWDIENGRGIQATWGLGGGTNRQAPSINAWGVPTSHVTDAAGCVDWIATTGATFYITGVQLEKGTVATPFEFRSIGQELALCQRYFEVLDVSQYQGYSVNGANNSMQVFFKVTKRATPTVSITNSATVNFSSATGAGNINPVQYTSFRTANGTGGGSYWIESSTASAEL